MSGVSAYRSNLPFQWTDARIAKLKELVDKGQSSGQIAKLFGISRNAVLGKLYRLEIKLFGPEPVVVTTAKEKAANLHRVRELRAKEFRKRLESEKQIAAALIEVKADRSIASPEMRLVSLFDLRPGECKWPAQRDVENDQWLFCGAARGNDHRYCPYHFRVAYPLIPKTQKPASDQRKAAEKRALTREFGVGPNVFGQIGDAA